MKAHACGIVLLLAIALGPQSDDADAQVGHRSAVGIGARSPNYPLRYAQPRSGSLSIRSAGRYGPLIFSRPGYVPPGASFHWPYGDWRFMSPESPDRVYVFEGRGDAGRQQAVAMPRSFTSLNQQQLRTAIARGLAHLQNQLARFENGAGWHNYFDSAAIIEMLQGASESQPPAGADIEKLQKLSFRLQSVVDDEKYVKIARLEGFHLLRAALGEYLGRLSTTDTDGTPGALENGQRKPQ